jgi:nucleoside-diphosphate-sugar epimerase
MRSFLAGASGAIGRPLTAMLVAAGHDVTGTTRSTNGAATIEAAGAQAAVDVDGMRIAIEGATHQNAGPDAVREMEQIVGSIRFE